MFGFVCTYEMVLGMQHDNYYVCYDNVYVTSFNLNVYTTISGPVAVQFNDKTFALYSITFSMKFSTTFHSILLFLILFCFVQVKIKKKTRKFYNF